MEWTISWRFSNLKFQVYGLLLIEGEAIGCDVDIIYIKLDTNESQDSSTEDTLKLIIKLDRVYETAKLDINQIEKL